jgi:hypothetical protein
MSQKPLPRTSSRVYQPGECCAIDIKEWTVEDFSGHKWSLHAIDLGSGHSETYLLTGLSNLEDYIAIINENWLSAGFLMSEMRFDDQFVTEKIATFLLKHKITRSQPAPYEHGQNGDVEILIKHSQETVDKLLSSAQLGQEYWSMALTHATDIRELLPSATHPTVSRGALWGTSKPNLKNCPILPFGTRVLAHLPLKLQTALSGRAFPAIYVGRAPGVKGAIKLFNPSSKRTILRRTFKVLGPTDSVLSDPFTRTHIEISDEEGADQIFYDSFTNSSLGNPGVSVENSGVSVENSGVSIPSEKKKETGSIKYRAVLRSEIPKQQ